MLYGPDGSIVSGGRKVDDKVDGFELSDGAIVSERFSRDLNERIKNDPALRERIEIAQRMTGKETLHMRMLRTDGKKLPDKIKEAVFDNVAFGEKVQERRINEEKTELQGTIKAKAGI